MRPLPSEPFFSVDSLEALLRSFSERWASDWQGSLLEYRVETLEDLHVLAQNEGGWNSVINALNTTQPMLASRLLDWKSTLPIDANARRSPGRCGCGVLSYLFFSLVLLADSSSSPLKEVGGLYEALRKIDVSKVNTLVEPSDGTQWLCGLAEREPLFVRACLRVVLR